MTRKSTGPTYLADVAAGASTLNRSSCVRLPALVPAPVRATLAGPAALSWQEMAPQVGKVRQSGWVLPYLTEWVDPRVRIDHAYGLVYLPGEDVPLHGDDNVATGVVWYRVERSDLFWTDGGVLGAHRLPGWLRGLPLRAQQPQGQLRPTGRRLR